MEFIKKSISLERNVEETTQSVIDMTSILEEVPPIKGVFSPDAEVEKLWSVPKPERREAVQLFRDKLVYQMKAWGLCRNNIEEQIELNPDLSREKMVGIINEFASHYGFTKKYIKIAESSVDDYLKMRKRIIEARDKFPNDIALVNRLTGMSFSESDAEDFEVLAGPMSFEISCSGVNMGKIYTASMDFAGYFEYEGFITETSDKNPISYLVAKNDRLLDNPACHTETILHEREHEKNRILGPKLYSVGRGRGGVLEKLSQNVLRTLRRQIGKKILRFEIIFTETKGKILQRYESEKDLEKRASLLAEYMRFQREYALNRVKDEIMAIKSELSFLDEDYNIFLEQDGGVYDYLQYLRELDEKKDDALWQETAQKILIDEYEKIIDDAITAFDRLEENGKNSRRKVIAILFNKRLSEWPKTVRRLLK